MNLPRYLPLFLSLLIGCRFASAQPGTPLNAVGAAPPHVALVLSGGGARGGAHIGVLRVLERAGVPMDLIVGTSFGGMIGSLYGTGYSTEDLELLFQMLDWNWILSDSPERRILDLNRRESRDRRLFDLELSGFEVNLPAGFQKGQRIKEVINRLTVMPLLKAEGEFDRFPVPFRLVATDILTGRPYIFRRGSLATAIRASIGVPGFFTPVEVEDALLVDGGIADNLPVGIARAEGAVIVIAVDVSSPLKERKEEFQSVLDVLDQVITFQIEEKKRANVAAADVVIRPGVGDFDAFDFARSHQLVSVGERAAEDALPAIRAILAERGVATRPASARPSILPEDFDVKEYRRDERELEPVAVRVEGLHRYPERSVSSRLAVRQGKLTPLKVLDRDVAILYGTGLFDAVGFRLEGDPAAPNLIYDLVESAPTRLAFGMHYDTEYEFTGAFELVSRDFRRSGADVFARALVGNFKRVEVGVNSGDLFGPALALTGTATFRSHPRLVFQDDRRSGEFLNRRYGLQVWGQYLPRTWSRWELGYIVDRVGIQGVGPVPNQYYSLASLVARAAVDTADSRIHPTGGVRAVAQAEWFERALGSAYSFARLSASAAATAALGARDFIDLGGFWGRARGGAPFYESFFAGGSQPLSLTSERFIGLERDRIAAKHLAIGSLEFRHRVKAFQLGALRNVDVLTGYQAAWFSRNEAFPNRLGRPLHGWELGLSVDAGVMGPIRLLLGATSRNDIRAYFSLGSFF